MSTVDDLQENQLGVTSTPRSTWIWARNSEECAQARRAISSAGGLARWAQALRYGRPVENVSDIDIGVDALEAMEALEAAGFELIEIVNLERAPTWY